MNEYQKKLKEITGEMYGGIPTFNIVVQTPEEAFLLHDMALYTAFGGNEESYRTALLSLMLFCQDAGNEKGVKNFIEECEKKERFFPKWFGPLTTVMLDQRDKNLAAKAGH